MTTDRTRNHISIYIQYYNNTLYRGNENSDKEYKNIEVQHACSDTEYCDLNFTTVLYILVEIFSTVRYRIVLINQLALGSQKAKRLCLSCICV